MIKRVIVHFFAAAFCFVILSVNYVEAQDNPLPAPTGPYQVGMEWRHWVDESRSETFDPESQGKREMMVAFFYPADVQDTDTPTSPYIKHPSAFLPAFTQLAALMGTAIKLEESQFAGFETHSFADAPLLIQEDDYPVLIFSHGAGGEVSMYTSQLEELASHGYVVVAINHTYGAASTVFPDGRTVNFFEWRSDADFAESVRIWSEDQIFVMDQLELLNRKDPHDKFTRHLDLHQIGVFGHSLGGATSSLTCFIDARCRAVINEDGSIFGDDVQRGLDQPVMLFASANANFPDIYSASNEARYRVLVDGFNHLDFSDIPLWEAASDLQAGGWVGSVDPQRTVELTRAYLVEFFDKYLSGTDSPLLDGDSNQFPEVTLTKQNPNITRQQAASFSRDLKLLFDDQNFEGVDELLTSTFVGHVPLAGDTDLTGWKAYMAGLADGISDVTRSIKNVMVSDDRVIIQLTYTGTHDGTLFGIPATGEEVSLDGISIFSIDENGLATKSWETVDLSGLIDQDTD